MLRFLFSFKGRRNRSTFWLVHFSWIAFMVGVRYVGEGWMDHYALGSASRTGVFLIVAPLVLLPFWVGFANQVKRWHDLDQSGWLVLINLIPFVGPVVTIVWAGFTKGTEGANSYGAQQSSKGGPTA